MTMRLRDIAVLLTALALGWPAWAADGVSGEIAARTELYQVQTLTLSDQEFLTGRAGGQPVTITGEFRIAQGTGRLPVVVLQHGSSGIAANIDVWSRELNALGISTFALDGFTGRGLTEVNTNQSSLGRLNMIVDIYRVLELLAKHARVDPGRIALMGFSRGGQATLYASLKRFHGMWNKSGIGFAAYIPFYPDCMTTYMADADVVGQPIRVFGGAADDYNPINTCKDYVQRLRAADHDVELTEYPNAAHAFDNPLGARPAAVAPRYETVRNCRIKEEAGGILINAATAQPFAYQDACVEHGPHLGYDPVAAQAAAGAVREFLRSIFRL